MDDIEKIIILNFETTEVLVCDFDPNIYENASDFFEGDYAKELGLDESNCQYMVVNELNIQIK